MFNTGEVRWHLVRDRQNKEEGVQITFSFSENSRHRSYPSQREIKKRLQNMLERGNVTWITSSKDTWLVDLDALRTIFDAFSNLEWLRGTIRVVPDFELGETEENPLRGAKYGRPRKTTKVSFYIIPDELEPANLVAEIPPAIQKSLERFQTDHPDPRKVAFVMMQFGATKAHNEIVEAVRVGLSPHGITAVRADDKEYHDDPYYNIMTYLHGCGFGIAIFERIEAEEFNPNVSLEVGYLLAMAKPVCLLKDRTIRTLPTDLVGKLYRPFDFQDPAATIPPEVSKWLSDRDLA